jgi:glycine cleavage system aminomethyltransferase T
LKISVLVSRTGYTGEDGFEIVGSDESIQHLWDKVFSVGRPFGLKPAGLGARDTLRTEVCYPLYGHELTRKPRRLRRASVFLWRSTKANSMAAPCWPIKRRTA